MIPITTSYNIISKASQSSLKKVILSTNKIFLKQAQAIPLIFPLLIMIYYFFIFIKLYTNWVYYLQAATPLTSSGSVFKGAERD